MLNGYVKLVPVRRADKIVIKMKGGSLEFVKSYEMLPRGYPNKTPTATPPITLPIIFPLSSSSSKVSAIIPRPNT